MLVRCAVCFCRIENMTKQLSAKLLEQKVLGFKMGVEGGSSNVRKLDYFSNGDAVVMLF